MAWKRKSDRVSAKTWEERAAQRVEQPCVSGKPTHRDGRKCMVCGHHHCGFCKVCIRCGHQGKGSRAERQERAKQSKGV